MKLGDNVAWTHTSHRRGVISMTRRMGTLEAIEDDVAIVRRKSGRTVQVPLVQLHAPDAPGAVGMVADALREGLPYDHLY